MVGSGNVRTVAIAAMLHLMVFASPAPAQENYFKGKQVTIVVGYGPGGGYDLYTRLLSRHLGKHLPGNPTIIIQHMPGAGSLRAANHIYNVAPKDGTVLGVFSAPTALEPLFGNESAKFETLKFAWIGNMYRDVASCGTWRTSGFNHFQDLLNSKSEIAFGASGQGTPGNQHALVLKSMMGMNLKVITGYTGIADVGLALSRNEIQAACALFSSTVKASFMRPLKDGELKILVQFGKKNDPIFGDATNFYSLLKTEQQRQVADLFFGQSEISRPIIGPPGMPGVVVAALRIGMTNALKDEALLADAAKLGVDIDAVSGEETEQAFANFYKVSAPVLQQAREIMGRK